MSDINWEYGAVCYAFGKQQYSCSNLKIFLTANDFKLNEILNSDYLLVRELKVEQEYSNIVEVFALFGFKPVRNKNYFDIKGCDVLKVFGNHILPDVSLAAGCKRQLTYHQIIAIGKLKRMMLGSESLERQSSYCRCKQIELGEAKTVEPCAGGLSVGYECREVDAMPEVKEPKKYKPIVAQVMVDLMERMEVGVKTYGEALRPNNGRDALQDAYEEALDLACYLKQAMIERDQAYD